MKKILLLALAAAMMIACDENKSDVEQQAPQGALSGVFSVSSNKKVYFSQGNLHRNVSYLTQQARVLLSFAENQWDTLGVNNTAKDQDVFCYKNLSQWEEFSNGKTKEITNGGYLTTTWRLPLADEWLYLFRERTNADKLFAFAQVHGVNGVVILPDNWAQPEGVPFSPSTDKGMMWDNAEERYTGDVNYTHNVYDAANWEKMENAGAVFLPAAGTKDGDSYDYPYQVNAGGYYMTNTSWLETEGQESFIRLKVLHYLDEGEESDESLEPTCVEGQSTYMSVRLVYDVK